MTPKADEYQLGRVANRGMRGLLTLPLVVSPGRAALVLALLVGGGLAEGLGLATFMPLFATLTGDTSEGAGGTIARYVNSAFDWIGIAPSAIVLVAVLIVFFWIKAAATIVGQVVNAGTSARLATYLRMRFLRALLAARWSLLRETAPGSIANTMTNDATIVGNALMHGFEFYGAIVLLAVYLSLSLAISWQITLWGLVGGFLLWAGLHLFVVVTRRAGSIRAAALNTMSARLVDQLAGFKAVKAMARGDEYVAMIAHENERLEDGYLRHARSKAYLTKVSEPALVTLVGIVGLVAVGMVGIDLATALILGVLLYRTAGTVAKVQEKLQQLAGDEAFLTAFLRHLHEAESAREPMGGTRSPHFGTAIEIRGLSFAYGEHPVLRDVDLDLRLGSAVALLGPSGSGKTTLVDILLGFYRPAAGVVLIDGTPLDQIDLHAWRRQIGYVPQEISLFNDSVLANVTLRDARVTEEEAIDAVRKAGAWDFVSRLTDGIRTQVGERGQLLSGGQRQRLALARALVRKPRLLVLDEPTSALDPAAEAAIVATLRELAGETTILVVTHQPALTAIADRIYRCENGALHEVRTPSAERRAALP